ncbi:serine hydrolase domain-containing protein [Vulgatibacter incomptus]|uniref:6-aminohexanoate-dimer hydrolase n=1 Tax=Vulgatibacter incomptus TaxID=1391653 RepID=A0A0K1PDR1_9BACT|nr:serine hydrolase [Vulgatibacter incomptus]AKU91642.1 6-aminohexanoate-dimer hydrolase [Vulgatibacter incomptus]
MRLLTLASLALLLGGCLAAGPVKIGYDDRPRDIADGWTIGTPESQGFDPEPLRAAYRRFFSEDEYVPARSLLVVRNGVLVAEGYCRDRGDIGVKSALMSATKSVTSLAVGIAVEQGLVSVERPISDAIGLGHGAVAGSIRLRDLLTMRSGLEYSNDRFSLDMANDVRGDSLRYILSRPRIHEPGSRFDYKDADPHLVSGVLAAATGASLDAFTDEHLLRPLGITDWLWLRQRDGVTYGAYGLYLTPRDFARLGQLAVQGGAWEGRQLVSREWLVESTRPWVEDTELPGLPGLPYGYYWWSSTGRAGFFAWGHGGQYLYVLPEKQLVIALTAEPDTSPDGGAIMPPAFLELVDLIAGAAD